MSPSRSLWWLAKGLEAVGLFVVLAGVLLSISEGFRDEGLRSMAYEVRGLLWGGGLFLAGWLLERRLGSR